MSDIHVLDVGSKPDNARCAFHYTTPAGNNFAGVAWSEALIEYLDDQHQPQFSGDAREPSVVPDLETDDPTEYAAIVAGTVYEIVTSVQFDANLTNAQKWALIQAAYTAEETEYESIMQERLNFWGHDGAGA